MLIQVMADGTTWETLGGMTVYEVADDLDIEGVEIAISELDFDVVVTAEKVEDLLTEAANA